MGGPPQKTCALGLLVGLVVGFNSGCSGTNDTPSAKLVDEGHGVFSGPAREPSAGTPAWSIVLVAFRGPRAVDAARQALWKVRTEGGVPDAFLRERHNAHTIEVGAFPSATEPRTHEALERYRTLVIAGETPYADAFLAPPPDESLTGSSPEFDLRTVRRRYGARAVYTLQVAYYGPPRDSHRDPSANDVKAFRQSAEQAVATLRSEGELAFYYHTPASSMVTVGVFGDNDIDLTKPRGVRESAMLRAARDRHPYNLLNGLSYYPIVQGRKSSEPAPSILVQIPE